MMLRYTATLFLFCLCFKKTEAQEPALDSLLKAERDYLKEDSNKVKLLNDIAFYLKSVEPGKGLLYAQKAVALAIKINNAGSLLNAYLARGVNYTKLSQFSNSLDDLQNAEKICESIGDKKGLAKVYNSIGDLYVHIPSNRENALLYFKKATTINEATGDKIELAGTLSNIGNTYVGIDSFTTALQYFKRAQFLYDQFKPGNKEDMYHFYSSLGALYAEISAADLQAIGFKGQQYDSAIYYTQESLTIADDLGMEYGIALSLRQIGDINLYQGKYTAALSYALKAKQLAQQKGYQGIEVDAIYTISKAYAGIHHFDSAYVYTDQYILLNDKLSYDEKKKTLTKMELKYEFDKKEDSLHFQNALLSKNNTLSKLQLRQQWLYSIGFMLLLLSISGFVFYRNRNKQAKLILQLEKERAEQKQREAEFERKVSDAALNSLRSQMNPHFIFNCLNSIKLYAVDNNADSATEYLGKFSRLMRLVLENSKSDRISLTQEIETLQLYMDMEAMRFKEKMRYEINIANNVDMDYIEIPPMLIQPYVENAIWHGLMSKEDGGKITLSFNCQDNNLEVIVTDNGVGRARAAELKSKSAMAHKSFGMSITHQRIELINQMYKTNMSVIVNDLYDGQGNATGTEIRIDIPVE